jgi:hypothetical protein
MTMTLDVLGELMRQMQADQRTVRIELETLRAEVANLQPSIIAAVSDLIRASERRMMDRMAAFEAHIDTRIDRAVP